MYFPDQRAISPLTVIRRDVMLPDEAAGAVRANEGRRVDIREVVANGVVATGYVIVDAAKQLGLKNPADLLDLLHISNRDVVQEKQLLAGKNPRRGKRVFSPIRGIVDNVANGRIILQQVPRIIDLEAGIRGRIIEIKAGRGVVIEAAGARVQGMWANDKDTISTMRLAPEGDLGLALGDSLERRFGGSVLLTRQTLTRAGINLISEQNLNGIIAPSMDIGLREFALSQERVILLTEGFGNMRMSNAVFNLLAEFDGQQVTVDGHMASRWETRYPEVIINVLQGDKRPSRPNTMQPLRVDMTVRLTREPNLGATGRVLDLPKAPILLDNGLRVACAQVELVAGEKLFVPLANLEVLDR